jgi:hypothetical protein
MSTATEQTLHPSNKPMPNIGDTPLHTWAGDTQVTGCSLSDSPSKVVFQNKLYVFYQSSGDGGNLYYNTFYDNKWAPSDLKVPGTRLSSSPTVVAWNDKIYVFHQSSGDCGDLWYNVFDGNSWAGDIKVEGSRLSSSPSAVVYNGRVFVFHQGGDDGSLRYNILG